MRHRHSLWIAFAALAATCSVAQAQAPSADAAKYPEQMVRLVVPFSAGSMTDLLARVLVDKLSERWKQQVIVENRPGLAGTSSVAKATADGYTLMLTSNGHTVIGNLNKNLSFDPMKDFVGISQVATTPLILVAPPESATKSVKELIALAKAKQGNLRYASAGMETFMHLGPELFKMMAGVDIQHVPFKGGGPALIDVMGGDTHMAFATAPTTAPHVRSGKLRALGIGGARRSAALPDVPTIDEAGVPGYECANWIGFVAPVGTPESIVALLHKELIRAQDSPEMKKLFMSEGAEVIRMSTVEFGAFIASEIDKWGEVVRQSGMKQQ
jgi:tripartite-type tricarboxylate transporter receptor subunit TctC